MTNRMVVLTGYRMEALRRHDRKKYDRLNAVISGGLKVKSDDVDWNSSLGKIEPTPCPWICPAACRECPIDTCVDRLAGGKLE